MPTFVSHGVTCLRLVQHYMSEHCFKDIGPYSDVRFKFKPRSKRGLSPVLMAHLDRSVNFSF